MWKIVGLFLVLLCWTPDPISARDVCETRVCIDRAKQFLDSMDVSVDPCEDFYRFSCGQFITENNVDQEEAMASVFTELETDMQRNLRKSIQKINSSDDELPEFMRQLRNLYDKCLDTAQIELDGMTSLISLLNFIDGYSFIDRANFSAEDFSFEKRNWLLTQAGIVTDFFIDMDFIPNLKNTSELIINFSHSEDVMDQSVIRILERDLNEDADEEDEESKEIKRYASLIFSVAKGLSANITKKEVTDIIILNQRLLVAAIEIMELKKNVSNLVNVMTVGEMQNEFPAVNWTEYIRAKTLGQFRTDDYDAVVVNVMEMGYMRAVNDILEATDPITISLYQSLKIIIDGMERVSKGFRNLIHRFSNSGSTLAQPRWKSCVSDIVEDFGVGISYVYVKDYGSEALKNFSVDIISRLKEQFEKMMAQSKWFDEQTFGKAKEKLDAVMNQIAYSDELLNVTFVESFYKGLNFDNMSYFDSILHLRKISYIRNVENYVDPTEFSNELQFVEVAMVNGFYIPFSNSIQIPMGILQSKFIDLEGPLFLNYGSMGFTMAHELSHAFDDFGRQFDFKGNVANWYSEKATELNQEKEQCIVDQYNGFTDADTKLKINGENTLSENMADLGGILISYYAYKSAPARQEHDLLSLPGLNYTIDQQFWLAFGTTWCSSYRKSKLRNMIEYDMHAPAQYRINGALQNVDEFARDFNCPAGTRMNPVKKCTVF